VPFVLVWLVPVVYWSRDRDHESIIDQIVHQASYLSMAWLSFLVVLTLARDVILLVTLAFPALSRVHAIAQQFGADIVMIGAFAALVIGAASALRGPRIRRIDIPFDDLHRGLEGFRIAQISDLHVGRTIRAPYVRRVVELTQSLEPDLVVLTGDMVDGPVERLAKDVEPLRELAQDGRGFFVLGNHDCYSGPRPWVAHFRKLGYTVLLNSHAAVEHSGARMVIGGVLDPAIQPGPQPDVAAAGAPQAALRLLLAHNPKSAPAAERAGFDLQLSGHTHAGQFFPWTIAVRFVHAPHVAGLSREKGMWVYVSAGTGTWGPPVRFGTSPELTLIRLVRSTQRAARPVAP
jgi:predicted MPP superfamily phosphohydrolase